MEVPLMPKGVEHLADGIFDETSEPYGSTFDAERR